MPVDVTADAVIEKAPVEGTHKVIRALQLTVPGEQPLQSYPYCHVHGFTAATSPVLVPS